MADHFAALIEGHAEAGLGQMIFPKLAGVVEENAGDEQVEIQVGIKRRDLRRDAHHLRGVLDQAAAAGVMITAGAGGVAETRAVLRDELGAERVKPRVANRGGGGDDEFPIGRLFRAQRGRALQKLGAFLGGERRAFSSAGRRGRIADVDKIRRVISTKSPLCIESQAL